MCKGNEKKVDTATKSWYNIGMNKEQVRQIRLQTYLLQEEFGKLLGVSKWTVSAWETGKTRASIHNQRKIIEFCEKYGIEIGA